MVRSVCHLVLFTNSVYLRNFPGVRTSDSNQAKISTYQSHAVLLHWNVRVVWAFFQHWSPSMLRRRTHLNLEEFSSLNAYLFKKRINVSKANMEINKKQVKTIFALSFKAMSARGVDKWTSLPAEIYCPVVFEWRNHTMVSVMVSETSFTSWASLKTNIFYDNSLFF